MNFEFRSQRDPSYTSGKILKRKLLPLGLSTLFIIDRAPFRLISRSGKKRWCALIYDAAWAAASRKVAAFRSDLSLWRCSVIVGGISKPALGFCSEFNISLPLQWWIILLRATYCLRDVWFKETEEIIIGEMRPTQKISPSRSGQIKFLFSGGINCQFVRINVSLIRNSRRASVKSFSMVFIRSSG